MLAQGVDGGGLDFFFAYHFSFLSSSLGDGLI